MLFASCTSASNDAQIHSCNHRAVPLITDSVFLTSARRLARFHAAVNAKTFVYHFTHATGELGAFHGSEIPFVFAAADLKRSLPKEVMSGAWVRFAATGDPNGPGLAAWPAYTAAADPYLEFGDIIKVDSELHKKEVDALTAFYEALRPSKEKREMTEHSR